MYQRTRFCPKSSAFAPRTLSFSPLLGKISQLAATFFLLAIFACVALAQEATIVGTVTDASGAVVPNAKVVITNTEKNQSRDVTSNESGQFVAPSLGIGHYVVRSEVSGFKTYEKNDIVLQVGDRIRVDVKLEVGNTRESVTVEAEAIAVKSESGEISDVITGQQVTQLATNGRSIYSLATLTAGASSTMPDTNTPTPVGGNAGVSFNGMRQSHNLWLVDGGEASDRGGAGGMDVMPSVDSIAEFRVLASNYSADYGLSSAATMTMVIRSGSKDFHAGAWEFNRNSYFSASQAFTQAPIPLKQNTYGFNVGGPVTLGKLYNKNRDKTFFFYNMEWRKLNTVGVLNTVVPTASELTGQFGSQIQIPCSNQVSQSLLPGVGLSTAGTDSSGNLVCAAKDSKGNPTVGSNILSFAGNKIPSSLINPNAQALLNAGIFPAANNGNSFTGGANAPTSVREEIIRVDHRFSDKFNVFGHYIKEAISQTYGTSQWSGDNVPTIGDVFGNPAYHAVIRATYSITPTILNEIAYNQNGNVIDITPKGVFARPSGFNVPEVFTGNNLTRIPEINLSGQHGTDYTVASWPWHNKADDYQVRDDLSWVKGSHQLKMGASWALYKKVQDLFGQTQGGFNFSGVYTGNDFADFLLGFSNSYTELAVQDHGFWNNVSPAAYFQDNWHVSSRLTLNLGLRWDGIPHTYEANNRMSNFYPFLYNSANAAVFADASGNVISPSSPGLGTSPNPILAGSKFYLNGIGIAGTNNIPNGLVKSYWANFGPRIGFAYDVAGNHKTVLRGGFGSMYERIQGNDMYNGGPNVPFSSSATFSNVLFSSPTQPVAGGAALTAPITVASITGLAYSDYKNPVSYQYSIGVERELAQNSILSVAYVGNQSRHQNDYRETNLPAQSILGSLTAQGGTIPYNTVAPYRGFNSIRLSENAANGHYNSLQISVHSQIKKDLSIQGAYTLSKAFDLSTGGDLTNIDNPYDRNYDYGPSAYDRRHIGLISFVYDLPIFRHTQNYLERGVLGGWQVSGIVTMESGTPLFLTLGGSQGSNGVPNSTNRPNFSGSIAYPASNLVWFGQSGFSSPAVGSWGNLGKGAFYGPGRHNWNVSLFKSFVFSESRNSRLELRVESFNTWNHTQFNTVGTSYSNLSQFGRFTNTSDPRVFQMGAKIIF
jgi:hypothetical protein